MSEAGQAMPDEAESVECRDSLLGLLASHDRVHVEGAGTKRALALASQPDPVKRVSLRGLSGVTQYEPSEFTFTAWAGTPVRELQRMLGENRQYLPFDPILCDAGATLGGTVATGIAGSGRMRYGGIRDFVLAVESVTGDGDVIRTGGQVVKNAAGFDVPKLMVGSLGQFGVMTQVTMKVFPMAPSQRTLCVDCSGHGAASRDVAVRQIATLASGRWELDALDYDSQRHRIWLRVAGPEEALQPLLKDLIQACEDETTLVGADDAAKFWAMCRELKWVSETDSDRDVIAAVGTSLTQFQRLVDAIDSENGIHCLHLSGGGSVTWIRFSVELWEALDAMLKRLGLRGLPLLGRALAGRTSWVGGLDGMESMLASVRTAMDPGGRLVRR
ncbi:MAG: FAD-binding protein [Planctomycetota bacterium]